MKQTKCLCKGTGWLGSVESQRIFPCPLCEKGREEDRVLKAKEQNERDLREESRKCGGF